MRNMVISAVAPLTASGVDETEIPEQLIQQKYAIAHRSMNKNPV